MDWYRQHSVTGAEPPQFATIEEEHSDSGAQSLHASMLRAGLPELHACEDYSGSSATMVQPQQGLGLSSPRLCLVGFCIADTPAVSPGKSTWWCLGLEPMVVMPLCVACCRAGRQAEVVAAAQPLPVPGRRQRGQQRRGAAAAGAQRKQLLPLGRLLGPAVRVPPSASLCRHFFFATQLSAHLHLLVLQTCSAEAPRAPRSTCELTRG